MNERLRTRPERFGFFQAVRLLARLSPSRAPVGHDGPPAQETARFRTRATLEFPPSEIHDLRIDPDPDRPPEVTVAIGGTTGPLGVLPIPYTELLIERVRYRDHALWEFLDLFNHRFLSLFHRAWQKYRFPIVYESGDILDTFVYRVGLINAQYGVATAVGLFRSFVSAIFIAISYYLAWRLADYRIF